MRFVDSNVFIYVITKDPKFHQTAKKILSRVEVGEEAVTSTVVLEEVFAFLEGRKASNRIPEVLRAIRSYVGLRIIPYNMTDMVDAVDLMRRLEFRVDWDDALVASIMKRYGVSEIYSNDSHFDLMPKVRRIFK